MSISFERLSRLPSLISQLYCVMSAIFSAHSFYHVAAPFSSWCPMFGIVYSLCRMSGSDVSVAVREALMEPLRKCRTAKFWMTVRGTNKVGPIKAVWRQH